MPSKRPIAGGSLPKRVNGPGRTRGYGSGRRRGLVPRSLGKTIACLVIACATLGLTGVFAANAQSADGAIVRVNRETGGFCSGFAIDPLTVATAAHCLWLPRPRNWIRPASLHVLAGYDRGRYRQHLRVQSYRISAGYVPVAGPLDRIQGGDWALLKLDAPFDGAPLPLAKTKPTGRTALSLVGFSSGRRHRLTRHAPCKAVKFADIRFFHDCPAGAGHSGAPVFAFSKGRRVAFGLHTAANKRYGFAVLAEAMRTGKTRKPY